MGKVAQIRSTGTEPVHRSVDRVGILRMLRMGYGAGEVAWAYGVPTRYVRRIAKKAGKVDELEDGQWA